METLKTIKELTKSQKAKADKIVSLLLELKKQGVHPIVIDGGGGAGLEFVCISNEEWSAMCDIIEAGCSAEANELRMDFVYTPNKTWLQTITTIVP